MSQMLQCVGDLGIVFVAIAFLEPTGQLSAQQGPDVIELSKYPPATSG